MVLILNMYMLPVIIRIFAAFVFLVLPFIASARLFMVACLVRCFVSFVCNIVLQLYQWTYLTLDLKFMFRGKMCIFISNVPGGSNNRMAPKTNFLFVGFFPPYLWLLISGPYPIASISITSSCGESFIFPFLVQLW